MGLNSTVVILNDYLGAIVRDPEFGRRLHTAIVSPEDKTIYSVDGRASCCAGKVLGTDHADFSHLYLVGGNTGSDLGHVLGGYEPKGKGRKKQLVHLLKALADELGYEVKRRT